MSVLSTENQAQLEKLIVQDKLLEPDKLADFKKKAKERGEPLIAYLIDNNIISDEQLTKMLAEATGVPYVNLSTADVDQGALNLLPKETAERFMAVPLGESQNRLVVAMLDANNVQAVDYLSNKIERPLKVFMASETGIRRVINMYRADLEKGVSNVIGESLAQEGREEEAAKKDKKQKKDNNIQTIVQDSPISRALNSIMEYAIQSGASDIHVEPMENSLKIRIRVDGVLREIMRLPKTIEPALISRIKILSNLKIDEHRIPQDGQFSVAAANKAVDLRVAVSPTVWGEQAILRLLDKTGTSFKLEDMGYVGRNLRLIRKGIKRPNGMILTSGPTGSGKSTSLYALIKEIKNDTINIITLEDPVEYKMDGVNQIQVNTEVGLTFATGLRSILRQDPDVVMVGEIRDKETAELAVQAALTGHLVFSTLHTNSASGVLPRLLDMGIEPFLIAATVNTIIAQRLVRRIDEAHKSSYQSSQIETAAVKQTIGNLLPKNHDAVEKVAEDLGFEDLPLASDNAYTLYKGQDSKSAPGGYRGRIGIYEVMDVSEPVKELILKRASAHEIERYAIEKQGMVTMRQDGYLKALKGLTTLEEVNRVTAVEETAVATGA